MTYQETLDYLFTQLPMYQRDGAPAMKKDLTNIRVLLEWLGNPHEQLQCIHVAGTNGKGTVCHLLAAALQQHGYRVGMYTSPHYQDFRERIKINGEFIPEKDVIEFTARLRSAELGGIEPSFFEITVAMAFDYFAREAPDFVVVEVGLGGRLDSTNIITPILSVITNIGLDHTQFLGETLPEIAREKAGIIKPGIPVVIGRKQPETETVFEQVVDENYTLEYYASNWLTPLLDEPQLTYEFMGPKKLLRFEKLNLPTVPAVVENVATALTAIAVLRLRRFDMPTVAECDEAWSRLHELTYYVGRFQTLSNEPDAPLCLADSAHNEDGIREAMTWLRNYNQSTHIVLGMVSDKDHAKVLRLFPKEATYYFVKADIPRGLPAAELAAKAAALGLTGEVYASVKAGYTAAYGRAAGEARRGVVFVGGSIFTVAEVID